MKYRDKKFYWTYQRGVGWPNDYISPDSMMDNREIPGFHRCGIYKEYQRVLEHTLT